MRNESAMELYNYISLAYLYTLPLFIKQRYEYQMEFNN